MRSNSLQKKVFRGMGKKHFNTEQDAIAIGSPRFTVEDVLLHPKNQS
jgi:hypothetical protein